LRMSNSVGIIDAGYRGNIMAALDNHSDEPYVIKKGTRLFQICCPILSQINMKVVDELSDTSRDTGGFGSTGK
jgi:dUTPase